MSEYQMWPHGYVALSTLCASRKALRALHTSSRTLEQLATDLVANRGHLGVAMRTLCALGWVRIDGTMLIAGKYTLAAAEEPLLERIRTDVLVDGAEKLSTLAPWLGAAMTGWAALPADEALPPLLRRLLSGAVLTPVLLALRGVRVPFASHRSHRTLRDLRDLDANLNRTRDRSSLTMS